MSRVLISRTVLTDLRKHFSSMHVLRTIEDAFNNQYIKRQPSKAMSVSGERRQLVEEYYASLNLTDVSDVQKLIRIIEREIATHLPEKENIGTSDIGKVIIGLEQDGYRVEGHKISFTKNTPLASLDGYLSIGGSESITDDWQRMLATVEIDPEDAITSARALVESTCKTILDELQVQYEDAWDLGRLYKTTAQSLQLSPDGYNEKVFKQILSGLFSVVNGLANVRNAFGDAHGKGKQPVRASTRHARFAINTAGSLTLFLLETLETRKRNTM